MKSKWRIWIVVVLTPILVWAAWGFLGIHFVRTFYPSNKDEMAALGQIGDIFGGVNALFAACAFAGVAVAAFYQKKGADLAREQLDRQAFEPLFFHLIGLQREITATIKLFELRGSQRAHPLEGREGIARLAKQMKTALADEWGRIVCQEGHLEAQRELVTRRFLEVYAANVNELGPYYRSLYHIFKLVDRARLPTPEKIEYANIARAALGRDELFLLMLNALTDYGSEFKTLIEKYGILKHLERAEGSGPSQSAFITDRLYSPTAWKSHAARKDYLVRPEQFRFQATKA